MQVEQNFLSKGTTRCQGLNPDLQAEVRGVSRDVTNQNATQFENTETEKGPGRERRHERGKNKVTDANATTTVAELCKSFKLR